MVSDVVVVVDLDDRGSDGKPAVDFEPKEFKRGLGEPVRFSVVLRERGRLLVCCSLELRAGLRLEKCQSSRSFEEELFRRVVGRKVG